MKRLLVVVAMLIFGVATAFAKDKAEFAAQVDSLVTSRKWSFRPITMQNPDTGTTRDVYAYNFYLNLNRSHAVISMPVEWVNMSIFTEEFTSQVADYSAAFVDNDYWRILFTVDNKSEKWVVELAVEPITGRVNLAIVTQQGTMRYIGSLYVLKNGEK